MKKGTKASDFIQKPKYIGDKETWFQFLKDNLKYPEKALSKKIEGRVNLSYEVNQKGKIIRVKVTKGIGYGCDEEAIRLVKMMKYESVTNRNLKVTMHHKIAIDFKLPNPKKKETASVTNQTNYKYSITPKKVAPDNAQEKKKVAAHKKTYTYTIKF